MVKDHVLEQLYIGGVLRRAQKDRETRRRRKVQKALKIGFGTISAIYLTLIGLYHFL